MDLEPRSTKEVRVRGVGGEAKGGATRVWDMVFGVTGISDSALVRPEDTIQNGCWRLCAHIPFPSRPIGFRAHPSIRSLLCLCGQWHPEGHSTLHFSYCLPRLSAALGTMSSLGFQSTTLYCSAFYSSDSPSPSPLQVLPLVALQILLFPRVLFSALLLSHSFHCSWGSHSGLGLKLLCLCRSPPPHYLSVALTSDLSPRLLYQLPAGHRYLLSHSHLKLSFKTEFASLNLLWDQSAFLSLFCFLVCGAILHSSFFLPNPFPYQSFIQSWWFCLLNIF